MESLFKKNTAQLIILILGIRERKTFRIY